MIPTAVLILWLASIVLAVYVGRHAVREEVRDEIGKEMIPHPDAHSSPNYAHGWNNALIALRAKLVTREWRSPMTKRGKI